MIETSPTLQAVIEEVGATFVHMTEDIVTKLGSRIDKGDERLIRVLRKTAATFHKHQERANDLEQKLASAEEAIARANAQVATQADTVAALLAAVAGLTQRADATDLRIAELAAENTKLRELVTAMEGKALEAAVRESDLRAEAIITNKRMQSTVDKLVSKVQDLQANMLTPQPPPATPAEPVAAAAEPPAATGDRKSVV